MKKLIIFNESNCINQTVSIKISLQLKWIISCSRFFCRRIKWMHSNPTRKSQFIWLIILTHRITKNCCVLGYHSPHWGSSEYVNSVPLSHVTVPSPVSRNPSLHLRFTTVPPATGNCTTSSMLVQVAFSPVHPTEKKYSLYARVHDSNQRREYDLKRCL